MGMRYGRPLRKSAGPRRLRIRRIFSARKGYSRTRVRSDGFHADRAPSLEGRPAVASGRHKPDRQLRSEEHTSELQSLMRISYAVFCLKKKITTHKCMI